MDIMNWSPKKMVIWSIIIALVFFSIIFWITYKEAEAQKQEIETSNCQTVFNFGQGYPTVIYRCDDGMVRCYVARYRGRVGISCIKRGFEFKDRK